MAQNAEELVAVESLTHRVADGAHRRTVLDDVSLRVRAGEWVVLRGPSGSGKTTLLALMAGLATPSRGDVRVRGESIVRLKEPFLARLRREQIGFVFQDLQIVGDMTVLENVCIGHVPVGIDRALVERGQRWLERLGLGDRMGARARVLSGGEQQRVAIARALLGDPQVLVLDEPTSHLDAALSERLFDLLGELTLDGRAVICATHDPKLAHHPRVSRVIELASGRVVDPSAHPSMPQASAEPGAHTPSPDARGSEA